MLHICTPLYRFDNLQEVYSSIPKKEDIIWHVAVSSRRMSALLIPSDERIKMYTVDAPDNDVSAKRNIVFDNIHDGWFCLLDDDTYFHEGMYRLYKRIQEENYVGMVNGRQLTKHNKIRLYTLPSPELKRIDTGNVLCHHSVLRHIKWGPDENDVTIPKDFVFWKKVYDYFGQLREVTDEISIYNALS